MEVLKILEYQNRCLEKFLTYSTEFLNQAEDNDYSQLNVFQNKRETLLKAFNHYDEQLSEVIMHLTLAEKTEELIQSTKTLMESRDAILKLISQTDEKIVIAIEKEKTRLTQELSSSDKNAQIVKKFKSTWVAESGETLDGKV